ncbi:DUF6688 family protein [Posidoniimonas polymericola]|uniref:DUF6688 family protein n=1 Tax=Posidoniimonas polymericola TaxID=2528002 RepID=UPI0011B6CBBA|nr:DUF6688 family protein [Posidoniimonas polymericola]
MDSEPTQPAPSPEPYPDPDLLPWPRFGRLLMFFWGVLAPVAFLIFLAAENPFSADVWQSGKLGHYAMLLLTWPSPALVYLFVLAAAYAMVLWLFGPQRDQGSPWVLAGLLTGVVVWLELYVLWFCGLCVDEGALSFVGLHMAAPIVAVLWPLPLLLLIRVCQPIIGDERIAILALMLVLGFMVVLTSEATPAIYLGLAVFTAPVLALACYCRAAWLACQSLRSDKYRLPLKAVFGLFAWFSMHLAAWRYAVNSMLTLYAQAPTEEPVTCFVASAAARGHARLVGAWPAGSGRVTRQLQRLKALELVLAVTSPAAHRLVRRHYNQWGPRAARRLTTPWLADAAYLLLKPCEWLAALVVLPAAGVRQREVSRLYEAEDQ